VFRATVPALVLSAVAVAVPFFAFGSYLGLLALTLVPFFALYGWLRYRAAGWAFEEDRLVVRYRNLARTTAIAPRRRLQSREVAQSPLQRRLALATFSAGVASGSFGGALLQVTDLEAGTAAVLAGDLGPRKRR
jgi:putative membrane protein